MTAVVAASAVVAPVAYADDMRARQWYLDAMKAEELWKVSTGKGITVAVLDSGVDSTVSELRGKVLPGRNFYDPEGGPGRIDGKDTERHGTNMAITIAGNGADGGAKGVAPDAQILPVKVSPKASFGYVKPASKGIRYAVDNGARIINMSIAGPDDQAESMEWQKAVDYALKKGALIFAGSGNSGLESRMYPAAIPGVIAVGALDTKGKVTKFSNYGDHLALAAPGESVPARCSGDKSRYCDSYGTSQATAIASASAALIWSAHPDWTANQVLRVMMQTAGHVGPVPSKYIGYGSIRPAQVLLEGKGDPGAPDVNPLLAAQAKKSPGPETSPSPEGTGASGKGPVQASKEPVAAARPEEGGFPLWAIAASAVAVVAIGAAVAVGVRSRRA
ncbi:S8 family serine peptidase [Streptomyces sp. CB03238]|uniref:S8 family serine peptidase n=1 Tax=Streptomyces sp. CB03238 TaxID=1907777 RepID=UPI000D1B30AF|nr:S8 family serine peptidase [Streptomyces sp. CB03238]